MQRPAALLRATVSLSKQDQAAEAGPFGVAYKPRAASARSTPAGALDPGSGSYKDCSMQGAGAGPAFSSTPQGGSAPQEVGNKARPHTAKGTKGSKAPSTVTDTPVGPGLPSQPQPAAVPAPLPVNHARVPVVREQELVTEAARLNPVYRCVACLFSISVFVSLSHNLRLSGFSMVNTQKCFSLYS